MTKKIIIKLILLIVLLASCLYFYQTTFWRLFVKDGQVSKLVLKENYFSRSKKELLVEVVLYEASTQRGLSNRTQLATVDRQNLDGMLFIFPEERVRQFWMKDMLFAIDICWFQDQRLIDCTRKATKPALNQSDENLLIYQSPTLTDMVLETMPNSLPDEVLGAQLFFSFF
jgi:uncharacterized membrane protein (UPF0127 family)